MSVTRTPAPRRLAPRSSIRSLSFRSQVDRVVLSDRLFRSDFAEELDCGQDDALSQLIRELQALSAASTTSEDLMAFRELLLEAAQLVFARWQDLTKLRSLALTDDLTGLYNRRGFLLMASQHLKLARRMNQSFLLFFMDVDNFKAINDSLGHLRGDAFLVCCSEILKQTFRETDVVSRLGGDEFAVLALEGAGHSCATISCRLDASLNALNRNVAGPERISFSTGTARFDPCNPASLAELLSLADRRMYEQKAARHLARSD